jgi:hypothetical protein
MIHEATSAGFCGTPVATSTLAAGLVIEQPKKGRVRGQVVALRKRNYSVYEISQTLEEQGTPLSATAVRAGRLAKSASSNDRNVARRPEAKLGGFTLP